MNRKCPFRILILESHLTRSHLAFLLVLAALTFECSHSNGLDHIVTRVLKKTDPRTPSTFQFSSLPIPKKKNTWKGSETSWFHLMILFRSLSKFPCSLLCVVRFLLFVDEWIGSPQSGSEKPQVLLRIPDYEASTCYGNLLFLLIVTFCIYIYLYSHTGIHMLQSMMLALRDIPIAHHMKVQQQRRRYCHSIFQLSTYFNILSLSCWFWGGGKLAPAHSQPAPSTLWCCSRVALVFKICHVGFAAKKLFLFFLVS